MAEIDKLGVVFWNTSYRAETKAQVEHLWAMEAELRVRKCGAVLLCLSEATLGAGDDTLLPVLENEGYRTAYRPTMEMKSGDFEGLAFASRDFDFSYGSPNAARYELLRKQRGLAGPKYRWLGEVSLPQVRRPYREGPEFKVASAHLSYPAPSLAEFDTTLEHNDFSLFGGDFNTLGSQHFVARWQERGKVKLTDPSSRATFPIKGTRHGFELDHVLADPWIAEHSTLKIGNQGPSNHRPLIVEYDARS